MKTRVGSLQEDCRSGAPVENVEALDGTLQKMAIPTQNLGTSL